MRWHDGRVRSARWERQDTRIFRIFDPAISSEGRQSPPPHASVTFENPHFQAQPPANPQLPQFEPVWQTPARHQAGATWHATRWGRAGEAGQNRARSMA